jgi:hypothetical protein
MDLDGLLAALGIEVHPGTDAVTLRDDRPLSAIRRAITHP